MIQTKAVLYLHLLCLPLVFLLSGCLDFERASIHIDVTHKRAEIKYFNIVSNSKEEETIQKDFRELIRKVYFEDDSKTNPDRITSKRLYRNQDQLDGIMRFSFKNLHEVLAEMEIRKDEKDEYFIELTKQDAHYQISGNGQYVNRDGKKYLTWPKHVEKIEFEMKSKEFNGTQKTSLLKYWMDWVDKNFKE